MGTTGDNLIQRDITEITGDNVIQRDMGTHRNNMRKDLKNKTEMVQFS
jgi:hypothetical protein